MRRYLDRRRAFNVGSYAARIRLADLYHSMLTSPRWVFIALIGAVYFWLNLAFGVLYFLCGERAFIGMREGVAERFFDSFFFSVQTLATIGYGRISPVTLAPNLLVTVEAFTGILCMALVTGLLFARFSIPKARVIFSEVGVISRVDGQPCFIFRLANERKNQIVEAHISAFLVKTVHTAEGERYREILDLKLERQNTPLFALMWTVIHPIDADSPLKDWDKEGEIMVTFTGLDDALSHTINARFSYVADEIRWNHRFVDMLDWEKGKVAVYLDRIHLTEAESQAMR